MRKWTKFFILAAIAVMLLGSCSGNTTDSISDLILIEDILDLFYESQYVSPSLWAEGADGYQVAEKDSEEIALEDGKIGVIQAGSKWISRPSFENPEEIIHDLKAKINGKEHTLYLVNKIESGSQVTYKIILDGREINPAGFEHKQ